MNSTLKSIALKVQAALCGFDPAVQSEPLFFRSYRHYPLFILGAPRSGSTLLYQLLLRHFNAAYISNLMALAPSRMISIGKMLKKYHRVTIVKNSHFGYIKGLFSPSEAGAVQRFWFEDNRQPEETVRLRNTIIALSDIYDGPLIIKNLFNLFRMDRIRSIVPEARFIHIRRDYSFNAQSLLLARRENNGTENIWWSIKPLGYEKTLDQSPEFQVVWQIMQTEKLIYDFCSLQKPVEYIHIEYEDLWKNTAVTLKNISDWLEIPLKKNISIKKISMKNKIRISQSKWDAIQTYISKNTFRV